MNVLLLALAALNPLSYPSYEQTVVAEFASPADAVCGGYYTDPLYLNVEEK